MKKQGKGNPFSNMKKAGQEIKKDMKSSKKGKKC